MDFDDYKAFPLGQFFFTQRKSKQTKMNHYKPRENIEFGVGARKCIQEESTVHLKYLCVFL